MPPASAFEHMLHERLNEALQDGTYKSETLLLGPQEPEVTTDSGRVVNLCANNYLGLAGHPAVLAGARRALDERGVGMASVRFICGTQDEHRALEQETAAFLGYPDAVLYTSCFDANAGLFAAILTADDVILSDELNHASIIDGIRLSKARSLIYQHADVDDLRAKLRTTDDARLRVIATDGVFSMEGDLAPLPEICEVAQEHDALVMVDDSHGVGVLGETGKGTAEHFGLTGVIDIQTGTFGKALGGGSGGYTTGGAALVELLRQRSRPYLFSNSLPPPVVGAARAAIAMLSEDTNLLRRLRDNTRYFRDQITAAGFTALDGFHPIVPIMIGDERAAMELAAAVRRAGILVVAFTHPVVPRSTARIRVQLSAAHERDHLDRAVAAFREARDAQRAATAARSTSATSADVR